MPKQIGTYKNRHQHDTFRHCSVCGVKITSQNSSKNRSKGTYTGLCHHCSAVRLGKLNKGKKRGKYYKPKLKGVIYG